MKPLGCVEFFRVWLRGICKKVSLTETTKGGQEMCTIMIVFSWRSEVAVKTTLIKLKRQQIIQIKFPQLDTTITNTNINFRNKLNKIKKRTVASNKYATFLACCAHNYNCLNRYSL